MKTILQQIVNVEEKGLTKPIRKFIVEAGIGMLISGTANLTEMARSLNEPINLKQTVKRLRKMSLNPILLPLINRLCLRQAKRRVTGETIFVLDSGDITHVYGKEFESLARVKDGSTGKISNGHNLNQVTGYDTEKKTTFPILLDLYSTVRQGFESANKEAWKLVREVVKTFGTAGLWVMDRGYDSKGHIRSSKSIRERISAYFKRWSIEEAYRFEKQGFGIEKATVRKFSRIQTLVGLSLLSWVVLARISEKEQLKAMVIQSAAMKKVKTKDRPRFLYYQLLKGIQRIFRGIGRVFRFCSTRVSRSKARWETIQRPLFDWPPSFLEVV